MCVYVCVRVCVCDRCVCMCVYVCALTSACVAGQGAGAPKVGGGSEGSRSRPRMSKWRQEHEEFQAAIRAARAGSYV